MSDQPQLWNNYRLGALPRSIRRKLQNLHEQLFLVDDIIGILKQVRDDYEAKLATLRAGGGEG